jgi:cell division protein FtsN
MDKSTKVTAGTWLIAAGIASGFILGLVFLAGQNKENASQVSRNIYDPAEQNAQPYQETEAGFTFYQELPELEVLGQNITRFLPKNDPKSDEKATIEPNPEDQGNLDQAMADIYSPTQTVDEEELFQAMAQDETSAPYTKKAEVAQRELTNTSRSGFSIQTGSFKSLQEADERRAQLMLLGYSAEIQTVNLGDEGEWHRVIIGPLPSEDEALSVREILKTQAIESQIKNG